MQSKKRSATRLKRAHNTLCSTNNSQQTRRVDATGSRRPSAVWNRAHARHASKRNLSSNYAIVPSCPRAAPVVPVHRTSRTLVPCQSYPCAAPVARLCRSRRALAPYQKYRCTVPVVPLHRVRRTVIPRQSYPCTVPLCCASRTWAPYPYTAPVVPLYRTRRSLFTLRQSYLSTVPL